MGLITAMVTFWLITLVVFILVNRGIWVFTDVSKSMSLFMLEKALGPPIDFVDGKNARNYWKITGRKEDPIQDQEHYCGVKAHHQHYPR